MFLHAAAAYTYYRTLTQEDSLKRRGKYDERKKIRMRRERLLRVRIFHNTALHTSSVPFIDSYVVFILWKILLLVSRSHTFAGHTIEASTEVEPKIAPFL